LIEEEGLYGFLNSDPTIRNLVEGRIYGVMLPPKDYTLPAIVHLVVASEPLESLDGDNPTETRRFQFDCYGKTRKESRLLSRAVRSLLVPKSDGSGSTTTVSYDLPDGTHVQSARLHMDQDLPFETGEGGYIFRAVLDVELTYS
jgi:hypothetical protein